TDVEGGQHASVDIVDIPTGPQQVGRPDRNAPASRTQPAQHEVFATLPVVRAVDQRQSQYGSPTGAPPVFNVEFVVVLGHVRGPGTTVGVTLAAQLGLLGQRYRGLTTPAAQPHVRLINVLAG